MNQDNQQHESINQNTIIDDKPESNPLKKYFLYAMVGGLILSAVISIISVLVGQFNEFAVKSIVTTLSIVVHSLLALSFVSGKYKHKSAQDNLLVNILFTVTVASFLTSILSLWNIITGSIIGHLFAFYLYSFIAAGLCRNLINIESDDSTTKKLANASVVITVFLYLLLMPTVFSDEFYKLPELYWRSIAATSILLGTTSVITAVLNRLYVNKHSELKNNK